MEVVEVVALASTALQSAVLQPQPFPGATEVTEVTLQQNTQNGKNLIYYRIIISSANILG